MRMPRCQSLQGSGISFARNPNKNLNVTEFAETQIPWPRGERPYLFSHKNYFDTPFGRVILIFADDQLQDDTEDLDDDLFEHHRLLPTRPELLRVDKFLMDRLRMSPGPKSRVAFTMSLSRLTTSPSNELQNSSRRCHYVSFPEPPRDTDVKPENIPLTLFFGRQPFAGRNKRSAWWCIRRIKLVRAH